MNPTLDKVEAPFAWLEQEPEDRVYWCFGGPDESTREMHVSRKWTAMARFDSEDAARSAVPVYLDFGIDLRAFAPSSQTRSECDESARKYGFSTVHVYNVAHQVVEEWEVGQA